MTDKYLTKPNFFLNKAKKSLFSVFYGSAEDEISHAVTISCKKSLSSLTELATQVKALIEKSASMVDIKSPASSTDLQSKCALNVLLTNHMQMFETQQRTVKTRIYWPAKVSEAKPGRSKRP